MKISVTAPVKNEFPWIGYSILAAEPYVHEFLYMVANDSDDGTIELLRYLKKRLGDKLKFRIASKYAFDPMDRVAYNQSFDDAIDEMTGDAAWFLHPDMIVARGTIPEEGPLAWWTNVTSYAGDFHTKIVKGRCDKWKNIHANKFGLHYYGGYGSTNEDFYHSDITGNAYKHFGVEFSKYPFQVKDSGISINHYCELKNYKRRLEKMKLCLKTQNPQFSESYISSLALNHPRVTLESSDRQFGTFEFKEVDDPVPDVILSHRDEFESLIKKGELVHG